MKWSPLIMGDKTAQVPVVQGGMGVGVSLGGLAGAVAKEGAVGIISAAQAGYRKSDYHKSPLKCNLEAIKEEFQKAKELAKGNGLVGFNIMVATKGYEEYVRTAVETGADVIVSGAGLPIELPEYVANSQTKIAPIVSSAKSARVILKMWERKYGRTADMVVIEGPKAGGHLGFKKEEVENIDEAKYDGEIKDIIGIVKEFAAKFKCKIPVAVAGGIFDHLQAKRTMELGADAIQVGSRFVTTQECDADIRYKETYIKAEKEDIMIVKSPVGMPGRAIKNRFIEKVMSGIQIPHPRCHSCIKMCKPKEIPYCITDALINAVTGNVEEALLFCGAEAYRATKIESVKEVIDSLLGK